MKKNMFMRLAMALVLLVLVTTSAVGGTYAKYTTSGDKVDQARVAKFGVVLDIAEASMFAKEYGTDDTDYSGSVSVKSSSADLVVAPGTSGMVAFSISGTPEVATKVTIGITGDEDIFLVAGTYADPTHQGVNTPARTFTLANTYYPVKWTLTQTASSSGPALGVIVDGKTLADVKAALAAYSGAQYAPNTNLGSEFELSWEWVYDSGVTEYNCADTLLGNLADGTTTLDADKYNLDINYILSLTVEQID